MKKADIVRVAAVALFVTCTIHTLDSTRAHGQSQTSVSVSIKSTLTSTFPNSAAVVAPREIPGQHNIELPGEVNREEVEGVVMLETLVGEDGTVTQIEVVNPGTDDRLLTAATEGIQKTLYTPGTVDGVPTPMRIMLEIAFVQNELEESGDNGFYTVSDTSPANDHKDILSTVSLKNHPVRYRSRRCSGNTTARKVQQKTTLSIRLMHLVRVLREP